MDKIDIRDLIIRTLKENSVQENSSSLKMLVEDNDFEFIADEVVEKLPIYVVGNSTKTNKPKLSVKCLHCGRSFIKKLHHKCNTGYRKRNHSWKEVTED